VFLHTAASGRPEFRSKGIDITADTVCTDCNRHWMSDLEMRAAKSLKPMLQGQPKALTIDQQRFIARWAAKTAMTLDQSYPPNERIVPLDRCQWVRTHDYPPPGTSVRCGRYVGGGNFITMMHGYLFKPPVQDMASAGRPPDAYRLALRVDKLVLDVTFTQGDNGDFLVSGGNIERALLRVWPSPTAGSWPPPLAFDEAAWQAFVRPDTPHGPARPVHGWP